MNNKFLKKILGIFGYKLIEKQVIKNNRLLSKDSFLTTERILNRLFEKNLINSLIQIGANDGIRFDSLNHFIKKYKTKSLLVEPITSNFEKLKNNYTNCEHITFENSAISVNNEIAYLFKVNPIYIKDYGHHIPGITSFQKKHLIKHGVKRSHIIKEKVNTTNIITLINKHNFNKLSLLFIDAEGYDGKIVIDFFKNCPLNPIIILEYIHIDNETLEELLNKLKNRNYYYFYINENLFCYPNDINFFN